MLPLSIQSKYSIRLGVAGFALAVIGYLLTMPLPDFLWMAIAAFMVVDSRVGVTIRQGLHRAAGTVVGAVLGTVLASQFQVHSVVSAIIVFAIIGYVSAKAYLYLNGLRLTAMTAAIIYLSITTGQVSDYFPWQLGLHRAGDNILGILVMVGVTLLIFPSQASEHWHNQARQLSQQFSQAFFLMEQRLGLAGDCDQKIDALLKELQSSSQKLQTLTTDRFWEDKLAGASTGVFIAQQQRLLRLQHLMTYLLRLPFTSPPPALHRCQSSLLEILQAFQHAFQNFDQQRLALTETDGQAIQAKLSGLQQQLQQLRHEDVLAAVETAEVQYFYQYLSLLPLIVLVDRNTSYVD